MSDEMLFDMEELNCLKCGRPLLGNRQCAWCDMTVGGPYKSPEAAEKIAASRDRSIREADDHADTEWKVKAYQTGERIARHNETLISEDIWDALVSNGITTHEPRAMGAVMRKLNTRGVIEATDRFITSPSPLGHGRPTRVWRSLLYSGVLPASETNVRTADPVPSPDGTYPGAALRHQHHHSGPLSSTCPACLELGAESGDYDQQPYDDEGDR